MQVIPAINCHEGDFDCVKEKIRTAEQLYPEPVEGWVHLDVADGIFTYNKTWCDPTRWMEIETSLKLEVHLMVEEPEIATEAWMMAGAKRVIVHLETLHEKSAEHIASLAARHGAEVMLALNPETPAEEALLYAPHVTGFQLLAVHPGLAGQTFLPLVLEKIKLLHRDFPNATIEVDGGINPETARMAKNAGADIVVAASYIFDSEQPEMRYRELCSI